jgi:hypothetical protein
MCRSERALTMLRFDLGWNVSVAHWLEKFLSDDADLRFSYH